MKRRDFLITASGTLAAAGASGCTSVEGLISPNWPDIMPSEMNTFLTDLDGAMNRIASNPGTGQFQGMFQLAPPKEEDLLLLRKGMRALLMVGNFGDLSLEGQVHPGMQKRLEYSAPEIDGAVFGLIERMASLSPMAKTDIKAALRDDPDLAERVLEALDIEATAAGVPLRRRMQLRVMSKKIIGRLKHSSDLLIDEYVTKSKKMVSDSMATMDTQKVMVAQIGEKSYKDKLKEAESANRRWQQMELKDPPIRYHLLDDDKVYQPNSDDDEEETKSERLKRRGLRTLGIGILEMGIGGLLIALGQATKSEAPTYPGVVLGVTVGPITVLVGLITLMVSAGTAASENNAKKKLEKEGEKSEEGQETEEGEGNPEGVKKDDGEDK